MLLVQCLHEGLGSREPVVFVYAFVFSSIRAESCSLGQGLCLGSREFSAVHATCSATTSRRAVVIGLKIRE